MSLTLTEPSIRNTFQVQVRDWYLLEQHFCLPIPPSVYLLWSGGYSSTDCSWWCKRPELSSLGVYSSVSRVVLLFQKLKYRGSSQCTRSTKIKGAVTDHLFWKDAVFLNYFLSLCVQTECGPLRPTDRNMMQRVKVWPVCCQCFAVGYSL